MAKDVLGKALLDFQKGKNTQDITTVLTLNEFLEEEKDILPLSYLFRTYNEMPQLEKEALNLCKGTVLDIGCGAGAHSLYLQKKGIPVTALDTSLGAIETCKLRGVENYVHSKITDYSGQRFDTLLLLMNGIGIAGTLKGLKILLTHLKTLLNPGGQILLDSSDIIYMFDADEDGGHCSPLNGHYYGEVRFRMEYKKIEGEPFEWLYIDYNTLQNIVHGQDLHCELVREGEHYDYLTRITAK